MPPTMNLPADSPSSVASPRPSPFTSGLAVVQAAVGDLGSVPRWPLPRDDVMYSEHLVPQ